MAVVTRSARKPLGGVSKPLRKPRGSPLLMPLRPKREHTPGAAEDAGLLPKSPTPLTEEDPLFLYPGETPDLLKTLEELLKGVYVPTWKLRT